MKNNETPVQFSPSVQAATRSLQSGHTLAEVMVSIAVIGFMLVSLYAGFSSGFAIVRLARENLRATQILAERMEVLRLVKWLDVNLNFIPGTFTAPFYASSQTNGTQGNFVYSGIVTITNAPLEDLPTYADKLQMIHIELTWTNGNIPRKRQMTTFVSYDGLQNYVYGAPSPNGKPSPAPRPPHKNYDY